MDSLGYLRRALVRPARATERTGPHRLEGSSGGRLVRTGEKEGQRRQHQVRKRLQRRRHCRHQGDSTGRAHHRSQPQRSQTDRTDAGPIATSPPGSRASHLRPSRRQRRPAKAADGPTGVELVCPHRKGRKTKPTQDGRACRKYKRRYKVERTHSWFHNFRRTIIRYETTLLRYTSWIHLACVLITLRRL